MRARSLLLSPLIIGQALWVAARATRLPEASGPRSGAVGQGPLLRLLVLGDSSAAGVGVTHQDAALAAPLAAHLARERRVEWHLSARTGATTRSTLSALSALPPETWDAAFVVLGVNDTKNGVPLVAWERRYARLLDLLAMTHRVRHLFVSGLPPIRHFPLLPAPLNHVLAARAERFDKTLQEIASRRDDCVFIPLDVTLDPAGMSPDGFHPGPAIYAEWAEGVAAVMNTHLGKD